MVTTQSTNDELNYKTHGKNSIYQRRVLIIKVMVTTQSTNDKFKS